MFSDFMRNETRALGIDVTISKATLTMCEEALRHHEMQLILWVCYGYIEQTALLFDFSVVPVPRSDGMQP